MFDQVTVRWLELTKSGAWSGYAEAHSEPSLTSKMKRFESDWKQLNIFENCSILDV